MAAMKSIGFASEEIISLEKETNWFDYLSNNVKFESSTSKYL